MSGCCNSTARDKTELEVLQEEVGKMSVKFIEHWERIYKRDEAFGHRIIKLEVALKALTDGVNETCDHDERIHDLENISAEKRLINIETWMNKECLRYLEDKVSDWKKDTGKTDRWMECLVGLEDKMKSRIDDLEELIYEVKEKQRACYIKPHPCPICEGNGFVIQEDVSQGEADCYKRVECRACEGSCVVWG